jgi:hypothetical protein
MGRRSFYGMKKNIPKKSDRYRAFSISIASLQKSPTKGTKK